MRLLRSTTLQLCEFTERGLPPYAILSHTWETEEVSFQEMQTGNSTEKKGYNKIKECCKIAAAAGFEYVWVDTCCIDKTSSAELTEAINSMYLWYQKADVCYVYLADYHGPTHLGRLSSGFRESRWFTRGWTLQELIAPESVIFFDSQWEDIGSKEFLREQISEITEIQVEALMGARLEDFSVAQRMCWASRRQTTRIEDEAYSLMGIFGVHMPMLYGEAGHAFVRLQEEIIKKSTDHTIFAWPNGFPATRSYTGGLLADCPSAFVNTKSIVRDLSTSTLPFEITNKGVHLHLPIYEESFGILDCQDMKRPGYNLAISLTQKDLSDTFHFEYFHGTVSVAKKERKGIPVQSIYVPHGSSAKTLSAGIHFQSARYYIECSFPYSGILIGNCWPSSWAGWASQSGTYVKGESKLMLSLEDGQPYGEIQFVDRSENTFRVYLKLRKLFDSYSTRSNTVCGVCITANAKSENFSEGHDRILWQHPVARWWISVGMSRAIISGKRAIVVTIKDEPE